MNASQMARALLLAIDPVTALGLPRPHSGQQRVIAEARRFNVIAAGRRWGKNVLAEIRIIETLLAGTPAAWFSPTYKTLEEDWRRLLTILHPLIGSKSEQDHRAVLVTGGTLEMWSLDAPDTARGRAYARVVIDEAASVPNLLYAWQQVIRPMLTDFAGDVWFISTPRGWDDFYTIWGWGQDDAHPEWRSWRRPSSENPHIPAEDIAQAERDSPPVVFRQEYLAEFLAGGIGQFFKEWDPAIHLCDPFDIPKGWRRFGMLDIGYVDPFCYLQGAVSPDMQVFLYREIHLPHVIDSRQAELIAEACANDPPEYIVAPQDIRNLSGRGLRGQSTADTYGSVWTSRGFIPRLVGAIRDRVPGWRRVREWLKPYPASNGTTLTAGLQIVRGRCPNLVRTLPTLVHKEGDPDDLTGDDHAADALRYGLMQQPEVKRPPLQPNPPSDFEAKKMREFAMRRQRIAEKGYIGSEFADPRLFNYRRRGLYNPSD